jgi:hypothetical protein
MCLEIFTLTDIPYLDSCQLQRLLLPRSTHQRRIAYNPFICLAQPGVGGVIEKAVQVAGSYSGAVRNELTESQPSYTISKLIRRGHRLVRRSQMYFQDIELKGREIMLIRYCTVPIIVKDVRGKESSLFITKQFSRPTTRWLCRQPQGDLDPDEPYSAF